MSMEDLIKNWAKDQPNLIYSGHQLCCSLCGGYIINPITSAIDMLERFAEKHRHPVAAPTELERLRAEVVQLRGWKKSASKVIDDWDKVGELVDARGPDAWVGSAESAAAATADRVRTIQANLAHYRNENTRLQKLVGGLRIPCQGTTQDKPAEPPKSEDTTLLDRTVREVVKAAILGAANATR